MRYLAEENTALVVHAFHDRFPRIDLLLSPNAGLIWKPVALSHDACAFRDEESARGGPLRVVEPVVRLRDAAVRAGSCQRRQYYPATIASHLNLANSLSLSATSIIFYT